MATVKFPVTEELQDTLERNKHITEVHYTEDGNHHFRVFPHGKDLYTRLEDVPKLTKEGIQIPNQWEQAPIENYKGGCDHKIVATYSREDILNATPVRVKQDRPVIQKADILDILGISEEEVTALINKKKK